MDVQKLNDLTAVISDFKRTWAFPKFMTMPHKIIGLFCGNQAFKTSSVSYQYVLRVLGRHPVPKKNVVYFECSTRSIDDLAPHGYKVLVDRETGLRRPGWEYGTYNLQQIPKDGKCEVCGAPIVVHQRVSKKIRLCSETLPGDKEATSVDGTQTAETKNTVYPELKKWMPPFLIKRDITFRNPAMVVTDPLGGFELNGTTNNADDIVFDFMSYSQAVQAGAGVQRLSIYCDEEPSRDFWDEQIPRLLAEDGDILLGLTPANAMTWTFDSIFEQASLYVRTPKVCEFLNESEKDANYKTLEVTDSTKPIAVLQAATDDNPTLSAQVVEEMYSSVDDPDVLATRRYGIHRQVTGRIFKDFDFKIHLFDLEKYFPDGMFHDWNHYRAVDYHPHNRWAAIWLSISPWNEAFVWQEWNPDPEKIITRSICNEMAIMSSDYKFKVNLIDALASVVQTNTGTSTIDDMNQYFMELKREGICSTGWWESWDTKGTRGREVVRERLKNAKRCLRPFNNRIDEEGGRRHAPTLWISNRCMETARSLKQWRLESWSRQAANVDKERKETPSQKWSHFCTALEALFKDNRVRPPLISYKPQKKAPRYFQGRRHARI